MWKSFYSGNELLGFPLFSMFFFITVFAVVVWRVTRPSNAGQLDRESLLPLDDGPTTPRTTSNQPENPVIHRGT